MEQAYVIARLKEITIRNYSMLLQKQTPVNQWIFMNTRSPT